MTAMIGSLLDHVWNVTRGVMSTNQSSMTFLVILLGLTALSLLRTSTR